MKKIRNFMWIFSAVLLVCAGMAMVGCPSDTDPEPPPPDPLENPDFLFTNGVLENKFSNITIENNKEYVVTIDVDVLDARLPGSHFQGQLFYTDAEAKDFLIAASQNSVPQNIAKNGKKYRITFKAGNLTSGSDPETGTPDYGEWDKTTAIPADAVKVRLTAKTPNWYSFGIPFSSQEPNPDNKKDDWDFDCYEPGITFGFNGTITIDPKPATPTTSGGTVAINEPDGTTGKGNITGDEFIKLKEAPEGSILKVDCTANVVTSDGGGTSARPGWGIAEFGTAMDADKVRGQNPNVGITIPRTWNGSTVGANSNFSFYVEILIDDILAASEEWWTFLNVYNGGKITKLEIFKP